MGIKLQVLLIAISPFVVISSPLTEVCFYHNTTIDGAYIQCGSTKSAAHLEKDEIINYIEQIQIGWNESIPILHYGLFTQFSYLRELLLNNANIETIEPRAFYGVEQLEKLDLFNNKISKLEPGIFSQLYIMRVLNLGANKLEDLEEDTFASLYQLEELVLRWNKIKNITRLTFDGLRSLRKLDLKGNRIAVLESDVFEDFYFLEYLYLSHNALKEIPSTLLLNQRDLLQFDVATNNIKHLPKKLFQNTASLQLIDVSDNLITHLDEQSFNTTVVEILKFGRNNITNINGTSLLMHAIWLDEVDIDFNPWICDSLKGAVNEFQKSQVYFKVGTNFKADNSVEGIECFMF